MTAHESDPDLSPLTAGGVENDPDSGSPAPVPAGGEGADSGGTEAVRIDETDAAEVPNQSSANDVPGVGAPHGATADSAGEQNEPLLEQNVASDADKVDGIVAQTRADVPHESLDRIAEILTQRFSDAGVSVSDEEIAHLAQRVTGG